MTIMRTKGKLPVGQYIGHNLDADVPKVFFRNGSVHVGVENSGEPLERILENWPDDRYRNDAPKFWRSLEEKGLIVSGGLLDERPANFWVRPMGRVSALSTDMQNVLTANDGTVHPVSPIEYLVWIIADRINNVEELRSYVGDDIDLQEYRAIIWKLIERSLVRVETDVDNQ